MSTNLPSTFMGRLTRAMAVGAGAGFIAAAFFASMQPPVYVWRGDIDFREYYKQLDVTQVTLFAGTQMPQEERVAQMHAWRLFRAVHPHAQRDDVRATISTRDNDTIFRIRVTAVNPAYCSDYFGALAAAFTDLIGADRKKLADLEQAELNVEEKKGNTLTESHLPLLRGEINGLKNSDSLIKTLPGPYDPQPQIPDLWIMLLIGTGAGAGVATAFVIILTVASRKSESPPPLQ